MATWRPWAKSLPRHSPATAAPAQCGHSRRRDFTDALDYAVSAFLTVFVVVDPIAMAPTFLVVTEGMPRKSRRSVAARASIIAGAILIGTSLIGDRLLAVLEISLPAFRIAGGLLLFWIAAEMVFGVPAATKAKPPSRR